MNRVETCRKRSAVMVEAMVMPSSRVTRLASSFWAASESFFRTPHSRTRLPNIRKPIRATAVGANMPVRTVTRMGKRIRVVREIFFWLPSMRISRSRLAGQQLDHRRLDDGHQRHVGVGRHRDRAQQVAGEAAGHVDGGRAVGRADDADGRGFLQAEAEQGGGHHGEEDAELGGGAEEQQHGLAEQRAEVDHGADGDEDQQREDLGQDAGAEEHGERPDDLLAALDLVEDRGVGDVDQDGAEADGQQQRRFVFLS